MPKKFKGQNSKAVIAKETKAASREAAEQEKKRREEDEYWKDEDKHVQKKQERKVDKERKRQEQLDRKLQSKLLLEEEETKLGGKGSSAASKVTRAQITEAEEQKKRQRESEAAAALPQGVVMDPKLEQNPNHLLRAQRERGDLDARTVDEAIDVLDGLHDTPDRLTKNLKALYIAFEERELPQLKAENPHMKLSQVNQLLSKKWKKSPENPMNH